MLLNVRFLTNFNLCNQRCGYCVAGQADPDDPRMQERFDSAAYFEILRRLAALPHQLNVRIGVRGEFFLSSELIAGARELTQRANVRSVNLITNLSFSAAKYRRLLEGYDLAKVALVASLHPSEIRDEDAWIDNAVEVAGFTDLVACMVAHPDLLGGLAERLAKMRARGLEVFVQAFKGDHAGRAYPAAYTCQERELLRSLFYSNHDFEYMLEQKRPGLCNAGHKSLFVDMTGLVRICGMRIVGPRPLGNLLAGDPIQLYDAPRPCTMIIATRAVDSGGPNVRTG